MEAVLIVGPGPCCSALRRRLIFFKLYQRNASAGCNEKFESSLVGGGSGRCWAWIWALKGWAMMMMLMMIQYGTRGRGMSDDRLSSRSI